MSPFWITRKESPYVGIRRPKPPRNWAVICLTIALILNAIIWGIGYFSQDVVEILK